MGACEFSTTAFGKDIGAAFRNAQDQAASERRADMACDGYDACDEDLYSYSGDIASKHGYTLIQLPNKQVKVGKAIGWIEAAAFFQESDSDDKEAKRNFIRQVPKQYRTWALSHARRYKDKWGPALAIELGYSATVEYKKRYGMAGRHGKVFVFFGLASS